MYKEAYLVVYTYFFLTAHVILQLLTDEVGATTKEWYSYIDWFSIDTN